MTNQTMSLGLNVTCIQLLMNQFLLTSQIQSSLYPIKPSPRKPFPRKHLDPIRNTLCSLNRRSKAMDRGKEPDIEDKDIIEGLQQEDKDEYFKPTRASRTTVGCKQCQDIIALRTRCTACFPLPVGVQNIRFFINITHYDGLAYNAPYKRRSHARLIQMQSDCTKFSSTEDSRIQQIQFQYNNSRKYFVVNQRQKDSYFRC